jgi:hypothetical protein
MYIVLFGITRPYVWNFTTCINSRKGTRSMMKFGNPAVSISLFMIQGQLSITFGDQLAVLLYRYVNGNGVTRWWSNYGPPSFNIWSTKVFYIAALIRITVIFYIYVKKKKIEKYSFFWPEVKKVWPLLVQHNNPIIIYIFIIIFILMKNSIEFSILFFEKSYCSPTTCLT